MNLFIPSYKQSTKIKIGDLVALMIIVQYEKVINKNTIFYDCSDPIHKNLKADILFKDTVALYNTTIEKKDILDISNLWVKAPYLLSKYGNKILPNLNLPTKLYNGIDLPNEDFIVLSTLITPEYNYQRRMEISFINTLIKKLEVCFKHIFIITDNSEKIICKTAKLINTPTLYDIIYLISKAKIYIGGDTGFTHFASIARVPNIISIYGDNYFDPNFIKEGEFKGIAFNSMPLIDIDTTNHFSFILEHNELSQKQINAIVDISQKQIDSSTINSLDIINEYIDLDDKKQAVILLNGYILNHPNSAKAWHLLALASYKDNENLAKNAFTQSLELDATNYEVYLDLAKYYNFWKDYENSVHTLLAILKSDPNNAQVYLWLGYNQMKLGDINSMFECIKKAYELDSTDSCIIDTLGRTVKELGDYETAKELFKEAIKYDDTYAASYFHLGQVELALGEFKNGWKNYEWRYFITATQKTQTFPHPMPKWKGECLEDKSIFVYYEQGLGDTIQFIRYIEKLLDICTDIKLLVQTSLKKLLKQTFQEVVFIDNIEDSYSCNYHTSILSLPNLLKIYIPQKEIIFNVKVKSLNQIKQTKFNVGLVWQGNKNHTNDHYRSIDSKEFKVLSTLNNVQLFSLQKDATKQELKNISPNIIDLVKKSKDFFTTAQIIQELDLVITIDSSVAHLAASLGKNTWLLLPHNPDWRWGIEGDTTLWYNNITLFRKEQNKTWEDIINKIYNDLTNS